MHLSVGEHTPHRARIIADRIFVHVDRDLLEFDLDGKRLGAHPVVEQTGWFGPGPGMALATFSTHAGVSLIDRSSGKTEVTYFPGAGWPSATSADAMLFSRDGQRWRLDRKTGDEEARKCPLRKGNFQRRELALSDGRTFVALDGARTSWLTLDARTGKKSKPAPLPIKNLDYLQHSVALDDSTVVLVEVLRYRKSATRFVFLNVHDGKVRDFRVPGSLSNFEASATHLAVLTNTWVGRVSWRDGELMPWEIDREGLWRVSAIGVGGVLTVGASGLVLRDTETGEPVGTRSRPHIERLRLTDSGSLLVSRVDGATELFAGPSNVTPTLVTRRAGLEEGSDVVNDRLVHWTPTELTLIEATGSSVLYGGAALWSVAVAGEHVLILSMDEGEPASLLLNVSTHARQSVSLEASEDRDGLWLGPDARYAVAWERNELAVYPKCGDRASYRARQTATAARTLVFSADGGSFVYLSNQREAFIATPEEEPQRLPLENVIDVAYLGNEAWLLAGSDVYRLDAEGTPLREQAAPEGARAFALSEDSIVFAVDGEIQVVERRV